MQSEKKILLNTFYQAFGKILTSLLGVVSVFVLTRYLGPIGFSSYSFILGFLSFIALIADFGLVQLLIRELTKAKKDPHILSSIFTLRLIISFISLLVTYGLSFLLIHVPADIKIGILLAGISQVFILLSSVIWGKLQAEFNFFKITILQIVSSVVLLTLVFFGIIGQKSLLFFILAHTISTGVGFLLTLAVKGKDAALIYFRFEKLLAIAARAFPFALWMILSGAYFKIDILLLSYFRNPTVHSDVGIYSVAYKIFEVSIIFGSFFTQTQYPHLASMAQKPDFQKEYYKYFWYTYILSAATSLILFLFAKPLVLLLGGAEFAQSYIPLQILSAAAGITIMTTFLLNFVYATYKERRVFVWAFCALLANIVLNLFYIPYYSYVASSWITLFTQTFVFLGLLYVVHSSKPQERIKI